MLNFNKTCEFLGISMRFSVLQCATVMLLKTHLCTAKDIYRMCVLLYNGVFNSITEWAKCKSKAMTKHRKRDNYRPKKTNFLNNAVQKKH